MTIRQEQTPPQEPLPEVSDKAIRIAAFFERAGFYPTEGSELTDAYDIEMNRDAGSNTVEYLKRISGHGGAVAAHAVVNRYSGYKRTAPVLFTQFNGLLDNIYLTLVGNPNPNTTIADMTDAYNPQVLSFIRYLDLKELADNVDFEGNAAFDPYKIKYNNSASFPVKDHIKAIAEGITLVDLEPLVHDALASIHNMSSFWGFVEDEARQFSSEKRLNFFPRTPS